jgi:hypothetical protein
MSKSAGERLVDVAKNNCDPCFLCQASGHGDGTNSFDVNFLAGGEPFSGFTACYSCIMLLAAQMANALNDADKYESATPPWKPAPVRRWRY